MMVRSLAKRASAMLDKGDLDAYVVWKQILRVIEELQKAEPTSGDAVHRVAVPRDLDRLC